MKLYDSGIYLVNGHDIVEEGSMNQPVSREEAAGNTMAYRILEAHNTSGNMEKLQIKFDKLTSHDITFVGIIQTARASGLEKFPVPYVHVKKMATIDKLTNDGTYSNLSKREVLQISRQRAKLEKNLGSISDLTRLPSALFVIDVLKENIAIREANRLGIPVFAIVDTNSDPSNVDFVIPANDDATKSIEVILDACCAAMAEGLEERKAEKVDMEAAGENAPKGGAGKKKATKARMDKAEEEAINAAKAAAFMKDEEEA